MNTTYQQDISNEIKERFPNLIYEATFVPFSKSRYKDNKEPCLNWIINLSNGSTCITTDYMQGIAYIPNYNNEKAKSIDGHKHIIEVCETGHYSKSGFIPRDYLGIRVCPKIPPPYLSDVMYCLVCDMEALNYTREEWCDMYGYDTDSIKAMNLYDKCIQIGIRMNGLFGHNGIIWLKTLLSDY